MGRQLRTLPSNAGMGIPGVLRPTTGGTVINAVNYGVLWITNTTAETIVLDPPSEGVRKVILVDAAASTATVVRGSTGQTVTFNSTGGGTILTFQATVDKAVELIGVNSTAWRIMSYRSAAFTTAINLST